MRAETQSTIEAITKSLHLLGQRMEIDTAPHRLEEFDARVEDPTLWDDPDKAQKLMRDRQALVDAMETYRGIERDLNDNVELIELGEAEGDAGVVAEAEAALKKLASRAAKKEIEALLNGEADGNDTFLEINAGAGGTECLRLGQHAGADVCPLGRKEGLQGRVAVRNARRRGRDQVGGLQDQRAERLWLAEIGKRRAPAGAYFALRFSRRGGTRRFPPSGSIRWSTTTSRSR